MLGKFRGYKTYSNGSFNSLNIKLDILDINVDIYSSKPMSRKMGMGS